MDAITSDKPSEAMELLDKELKSRIEVAMADKKPEVAKKVFGQDKEKTDETDN